MYWLIALMFAVVAKAAPADPLIIEINGDFGLAERNGKVLLGPKYHKMGLFSEGLAWFEVRDEKAGSLRYGFVNRKGKPAITPTWEAVGDFHSDRATVKVGSTWGYLNSKGKLAIPAKFLHVEAFSEDRATVELEQDKFVVIDPAGNTVFPLDGYQAKDMQSYHEGLLVVVPTGDGPAKVLDKTGKVVFTAPGKTLESFSDGLALFKGNDERLGFLDKTGKIVIQPNYAFAKAFSEGLAPAEQDGRWGYIDKTGQWSVQPIFEEADSFAEGLSRIRVGTQFGYSDRQGHTVISPVWEDPELPLSRFKNGVVLVGKQEGGKLLRGWIDKSGNAVWSAWKP